MVYDDGFGRPQIGFAMPRMTPVVRVLLIANVAVFLLQSLIFLVDPLLVGTFWRIFGLNPSWWSHFYFPIYQLATYAFVHGDGGHVFFNMLSLYFFGTMLEALIGSRRFALFYTAAILIGGLAHLATNLAFGRDALAIGASGGTMAVLVAMAVLRPQTLVIVLFFPVRLWVLAAVLASFDVWRLATDLRFGEAGRVAYMVHLGGAIFGYLAVKRGWVWRDLIEERSRKRAIKEHERGLRDEQRMDELLAKIHREGMNALTRQEKEFLKRMSKR